MITTALILFLLAIFVRSATRRRPEPEPELDVSLLAAFIEAGMGTSNAGHIGGVQKAPRPCKRELRLVVNNERDEQ